MFKYDYLKEICLMISILSLNIIGCTPIPDNSTTPTEEETIVTPTSPTTSLLNIEQSVHSQINQYRKSRNLPSLTIDNRISNQARIHSQNMATGKVAFSHDGFELRIQAINIPYRSVAENVAFNYGHSDPATQAVQGWIQSNGHRQNIEGYFNLTGIGVAKNAKGEYYFTQIFLKQR